MDEAGIHRLPAGTWCPGFNGRQPRPFRNRPRDPARGHRPAGPRQQRGLPEMGAGSRHRPLDRAAAPEAQARAVLGGGPARDRLPSPGPAGRRHHRPHLGRPGRGEVVRTQHRDPPGLDRALLARARTPGAPWTAAPAGPPTVSAEVRAAFSVPGP